VGASCAQCHPTTRAGWGVVTEDFRLELHAASEFSLERPHDKAGCADCHAGYGTEVAYADRYPGRKASDCAACHADPHGGQFRDLRGAPQACVECHGGASFAAHAFDVARHARTAFALDGSHLKVKCEQCHTREGERPRRFRGTSTRCSDCHADVHGDAFYASVPDGSRDCQSCHGTSSFEAEHDFDSAVHALRAAFALDGAHRRAECERCHVRAPVEDELGRRFGRVASIFGVPPDECSTCHVDAHAGAFDSPSLPASVGERTTCARCHDTERFRPVATPFNHGAWTGLPLEGAHARAVCAACHAEPPPLAKGRGAQLASARTLGDVRAPLGDVRAPLAGSQARACSACHRDVHAGMFAASGRPERVDGREECARCHGVESFRDVVRTEFDHAAWTGFELEGRHAAAACEACHVPGPRDALGRAFGRASGASCSDCHLDPHVGQFSSRSCQECHASSQAWSAPRFDHARDSRFALDANHEKLACAACHRPWPLANGRTAIRYKPLGTTCVECHGFEKGKG